MAPFVSVAQWLDACVALEAKVTSSISGDTHYYKLRPPFLQKHIRKKKEKKL